METYIENLKREKRSAYMVQIRKENNDKLFALKRNNILSEPSNKKVLSNASEEIIDVNSSY